MNHEHDTDTITKKTKVPISVLIIAIVNTAIIAGMWTDLSNKVDMTDRNLTEFIREQQEINARLESRIQDLHDAKIAQDDFDQMMRSRLNIKQD